VFKPIAPNLENIMSTTSTSNGRPQRRQLSDQLDRFDAMLDGFSEGLSEAVSDAARAGTRMAVKDAIIEILTDPELRGQLHQATAPASAPIEKKPGFWSRMKIGIGRVGGMLRGAAALVTGSVASSSRRVGAALKDPLQAVGMLGGSVGMIVATLSYFAPHLLSAAVSGVRAAVTAMAVQLGLWARRTFRVFSAT
jgi:hypothetical protein